MKVVLVILLLVVFSLSIYLRFFTSLSTGLFSAEGPYHFVKAGSQDSRCMKRKVFKGNCLMAMWDVQYDPQTNSCKTVNGGGCGSEDLFESKIDCEQSCVADWKAKTGYELLLTDNEFESPITREFTRFDKSGKAILAETTNSNTKYTLLDAHKLTGFSEDYIVAIANKGSSTWTANSGGGEYNESYILLFRKEGNKPYNLIDTEILDPEWVSNISIKQNQKIVTITYKYRSCGGSQVSCHTSFSKNIEIIDKIKTF